MKKMILGLSAIIALSACSTTQEVRQDEGFREEGVDFTLCLEISRRGKEKGRRDKRREARATPGAAPRVKSDNRQLIEGILIQNRINPSTNLAEGMKCYDTGYEIGYYNPNPDIESF